MSYRVLISTPHPDWPLLRQLPGQAARMFDKPQFDRAQSDATERVASMPRSGTWDDWTFFIDQEVDEVDAWIVLEDIPTPHQVRVSPQNTLLLTGEPPSMRRYRTSYISQFAHVITCHPSLANTFVRSPDIQLAPQGLPWHIGVDRLQGDRVRFAHTDFATAPKPTKSGLLSVICSNKNITRDHRARQEFVKILQAHFGSELALFGRGYQEIGDKWDAIAPYRFHIVLENDATAHYFSEKLTDCFLAQSYPLYYGAPNAAQYFPQPSFTAIDIHQPEAAIATIEAALANRLDEKHAQDVIASRDLVLNEYNLFSIVRNFFSQRLRSGKPVEQTIYPRRHKWSLQWAKLQRFQRRFTQAA